MSSSRGTNKLNENLRKKYPFIEKTKSQSDVLCKKCGKTFSIANGGNTEMKRHIESIKHMEAVEAAASSKTITSHFMNICWSKQNLDVRQNSIECGYIEGDSIREMQLEISMCWFP